MRLHLACVALCNMLLFSTSFPPVSAAAVLNKRTKTVVPYLTGAALSDAVAAVKASPMVNMTIPKLQARDVNLFRRAYGCDNSLECARNQMAIELATLLAEGSLSAADAAQVQLLQAMQAALASSQQYASLAVAAAANAASQSQDMAGDVAESVYLTFADNSYALTQQLISSGAVETVIQLPASIVFVNMLFSLSSFNAILPYCDDQTFDALASRIADLVDGFMSQFITEDNADNMSPVVLSAIVDSSTGDVAGTSIGGNFLLGLNEFVENPSCPAYGETW